MKRTALILLTAIYLLSSLGVAANSYYCCGKLQLTTITDAAKPDCKMAAAMPKCCKTKKQYFKVKDQHIGASVLNLNSKLFHVINTPYLISRVNLNIPNHQIISFYRHAPPDWLKAPVYMLNCSFKI